MSLLTTGTQKYMKGSLSLPKTVEFSNIGSAKFHYSANPKNLICTQAPVKFHMSFERILHQLRLNTYMDKWKRLMESIANFILNIKP
jgi:hypothetical protein